MMLALAVFLPLLGAVVTGMLVRLLPAIVAEIITTSSVIASAVASTIIFSSLTTNDAGTLVYPLMRWLDVGNVQVGWELYADRLTGVMCIVVTYVSSLVHIYAIGYMHDDPHRQRFMAYLSLFTFSMLLLVTSSNIVQLFVGWEGVGVCSYLLIGFWYRKESANAAAVKAFIVNRVADAFLLIGMAALLLVFGSFNFADIFAGSQSKIGLAWDIPLIGVVPVLDVICILLFVGCMGKSAQFIFHVWLPDAMEGPTPVSALIHAATMVTAGVFLVARFSPLFEQAHMALQMVMVVGMVTSLFAGLVGLVQDDIKRIIAYSTCSQLGYMFFACGASAYDAAIFHLATHAFFKALLFLTAGSVIHAVAGEQSIFKMGNLWRKIPFTYACMWIGSLALAGIPPFAGYYSKDMILESVFYHGGSLAMVVYWVGVFGAFLTALYSWRLLLMVFHGKSNVDPAHESHIHESPVIMLLPLAMLAVGAIFAGVIGTYVFGMVANPAGFWMGDIAVSHLHEHNGPWWVAYMPLIAGLSGILTAYILYLWRPAIAARVKSLCSWLYNFLYKAWYVDCIYHVMIVKPLRAMAVFFWHGVDQFVIDEGGPLAFASIAKRLSRVVTSLHTGLVYHYAFVMLLALTSLLTWYVLRLGGPII